MTLNAERVGRAVERATGWHGDQVRKGTSTPYLSHLLGVASLILEDGGDEDQVIAGLLHDAAEDQGGEATLAVIQQEFGERVARIVRACSDSLTEDPSVKAPWRERKERAIATIAEAPDDVLIVVAADKLHNLRSTVADYAVIQDAVWDKFKTGREGFLWYHDQLHDVLVRRIPDSRSVAGIEAEMATLRAALGTT